MNKNAFWLATENKTTQNPLQSVHSGPTSMGHDQDGCPVSVQHPVSSGAVSIGGVSCHLNSHQFRGQALKDFECLFVMFSGKKDCQSWELQKVVLNLIKILEVVKEPNQMPHRQLLQLQYLILDCRAVTTTNWIAPCHHGAIL